MPTMPANETRGKCSMFNLQCLAVRKKHTGYFLQLKLEIIHSTFNQNQNVLFHVNIKHYYSLVRLYVFVFLFYALRIFHHFQNIWKSEIPLEFILFDILFIARPGTFFVCTFNGNETIRHINIMETKWGVQISY